MGFSPFLPFFPQVMTSLRRHLSSFFLLNVWRFRRTRHLSEALFFLFFFPSFGIGNKNPLAFPLSDAIASLRQRSFSFGSVPNSSSPFLVGYFFVLATDSELGMGDCFPSPFSLKVLDFAGFPPSSVVLSDVRHHDRKE